MTIGQGEPSLRSVGFTGFLRRRRLGQVNVCTTALAVEQRFLVLALAPSARDGIRVCRHASSVLDEVERQVQGFKWAVDSKHLRRPREREMSGVHACAGDARVARLAALGRVKEFVLMTQGGAQLRGACPGYKYAGPTAL